MFSFSLTNGFRSAKSRSRQELQPPYADGATTPPLPENSYHPHVRLNRSPSQASIAHAGAWPALLDSLGSVTTNFTQMSARQVLVKAKSAQAPLEALRAIHDMWRKLPHTTDKAAEYAVLSDRVAACISALWDPVYTRFYETQLLTQNWSNVIELHQLMQALPATRVPTSLYSLKNWQPDTQALQRFIHARSRPTVGPKTEQLLGWLCALEGPFQPVYTAHSTGKAAPSDWHKPCERPTALPTLASFLEAEFATKAVNTSASVALPKAKQLGFLNLDPHPQGPAGALFSLKTELGCIIQNMCKVDAAKGSDSLRLDELLWNLERREKLASFVDFSGV